MAETSTKLGRVSLVPRGAYDQKETYNRLDIVEYDGSSYLVLTDGTTGAIPANTPPYMLIAGKGGKGDTGEQGKTGKTGAAGSDGVGIQQIERTAGNGFPGSTDTYTITLTNGQTAVFYVYNGRDGERGASGADGTSLTILGRYDTLSDLEAAHPMGSAGEAWAVGSAEANNIYLWDVDAQAWVNIGSLQGPPGPAGGPKGDPFTYDDFTPEQLEGLRGPPGRDGASAYELAVQGGFTGREEEFNRWLAQAGNGSGGGTAGAGAVPEKIVEAFIIGGGQAWVESDAPTGYYYQDVPVEGCREWHRARIIIQNILDMPYVRAMEILPTVETRDSCIRVWGRKQIGAKSIAISVELYSEGAGSGTGTGYTLPVASADRLGGVKVGSGVGVEEDGTISVDAAGALGEAIATPDEVNAALDQAFEEKGGGEDGRQL